MGRYTEYTKKSVHLTIKQFSANVTKKQNNNNNKKNVNLSLEYKRLELNGDTFQRNSVIISGISSTTLNLIMNLQCGVMTWCANVKIYICSQPVCGMESGKFAMLALRCCSRA